MATPNELGLSPQVYDIYESAVKSFLSPERGVGKEQIAGTYSKVYGRRLGWKQLEPEILPALEASGLVSLQTDLNDRRRTVVCPPDEAYISSIDLTQTM